MIKIEQPNIHIEMLKALESTTRELKREWASPLEKIINNSLYLIKEIKKDQGVCTINGCFQYGIGFHPYRKDEWICQNHRTELEEDSILTKVVEEAPIKEWRKLLKLKKLKKEKK